MNGFGEQIAVLDGITIAPGGGNYGGGASYPDEGRWPLLPSNAGLNALAAHDDLMGAANNVYNKRVFASFSGGANMSGGSSYPDSGRFPVWAQGGAGMAGLAGCGCRFEGLGATPRMSPQARAQTMKNIQFRSQQMVNLRNAARRTAPGSMQRAHVVRAYHQNLVVLCILRSRVGLPTLPECQKLVARMKVLQNRRAR
jgi:hypothetical protein